MLNIIEQFRNAMVAANLTPPTEIHADGKKHRFSTNDKTNDTAGEYCIYTDSIPAGYFKDYRSGLYQSWHLDMGRPYTPQEHLEFKEAQKRRQEQEQIEEEAAAKRAQEIWDAAPAADPNFEYLITKGIKPIGLRMHKDCLLIPVMLGNKLYSLQCINRLGEKKFMPNGRTHAAYFPIGDFKKTICICEGAATAISIHEATGYAVAAALSCGNLPAVAQYLRNEIPDALILICIDDDAAGLKFGKQAAELVNGRLAVPIFDENRPEKANDFNDMAKLYGLDRVKAIITAAYLSPATPPLLEEEWPPLMPLSTHNLPRLNLANLPGWLGEYAQHLSESTSTPLELAAGLILAVCATAAARRFKILVKPGYFEPANLWVIVALESGNRKSAVQATVTKPLDIWERKQAKIMELEIKRIISERKNIEARVQEKRKQAARAKDASGAKNFSNEATELEAALPNIPTLPSLWLSDTTPEELAVQLKNNDECMAWLSSEGGMFDLLAGRYSKGEPNLDLMLKTHSGDSEKITRKSSKPIFLYNPLVTVGLSPQPNVLSGLASIKGFRGRGLLGRCLYLIPPSSLGYRTSDNKSIPEHISNEYIEAVQAMLNWKPAINKETGEKEFHIVKFSDEARNKYDAFFQANELEMQPGGKLEHFKDWGGKAPGAAVRIAGVMHGTNYAYDEPWTTEVSGKTMDDAIAIITVIIDHSLAALDFMGTDPIINSARKILDWIRDRKIKNFTINEAFRGLRGGYGLKSTKQVKEALEALEERGYVIIDQPSQNGRGRPTSPMVRVNPKVHE